MIKVGDCLPEASVLLIEHDKHEEIQMSARLDGKKIAIFAMPGAFSSTCAFSHMPNIISNTKALREKGIEEVIVLTVNDIFVSREWAKQSGAFAAGITLVIGAAYTLWMYKRVMFGEIARPKIGALLDLNSREIIVLGISAFCILWMGVYPSSFTQFLHVTVDGLLSHVGNSKL